MAALATDPALFILTSLTAGSSHIVTATSRLETILRANRIPFKAVDIATDQKARILWSRRAGKDPEGRVRKLPGLVQEGFVIGDLVEIEEWNEYGELKEHVKIHYDEHTIPSINNKPPSPKLKPRAKPTGSTKAATAISAATGSSSSTPAEVPEAPPLPDVKKPSETGGATKKAEESKPVEKNTELPIRSVADEAAQKAKEMRLKTLREKVHGKEGTAAKEAEAKAAAGAGNNEETEETAKGESTQDVENTPKEAEGNGTEEAKKEKIDDETKVEEKPEADKQASAATISNKEESHKEAGKEKEDDGDEEEDDDDDDSDDESEYEDATASPKK